MTGRPSRAIGTAGTTKNTTIIRVINNSNDNNNTINITITITITIVNNNNNNNNNKHTNNNNNNNTVKIKSIKKTGIPAIIMNYYMK